MPAPALARCLLAAVLAMPLAALDGFAVVVHGPFGSDSDKNGKPGAIIRYDIAGSTITTRRELHPGPARVPAISPDGSQIAFLKADGGIAVMPAAGGPAKDLAVANPGSHLDFVGKGWIYYNLGAPSSPGSQRIRRVNAGTGADEKVVDLKGDQIWRFQVSHDGKRMQLDRYQGHKIFVYDVTKNDGLLGDHNAIVGTKGFPNDSESCGGGMSPGGAYFMVGAEDHNCMHIYGWDGRKRVASFFYLDSTGKFPTAWFNFPTGTWHERNGWSTNSNAWLMVRLETEGQSGKNVGNIVLVNWIEQRFLPLSTYKPGEGLSDDLGDLWVAGHSPTDTVTPPPERNTITGKSGD